MKNQIKINEILDAYYLYYSEKHKYNDFFDFMMTKWLSHTEIITDLRVVCFTHTDTDYIINDDIIINKDYVDCYIKNLIELNELAK